MSYTYNPTGPGSQPVRKTDTLSILGLVFAFIFWPAGIILSALGLASVRRKGTQGAGLAIAGLIVSVVALIVIVVGGLTLIRYINSLPSEQKSTPTATSASGSKLNPYPAGTTVTLNGGSGESWDVSVADVNWEANQTVYDANMYNSYPDDGETYVTVSLTAEFHTVNEGDSKPAYEELDVRYISASGQRYHPDDVTSVCCVEPEWDFRNEVFDGESTSGVIVLSIPEEEVRTGIWMIETSSGDTAFVSAR